MQSPACWPPSPPASSTIMPPRGRRLANLGRVDRPRGRTLNSSWRSVRCMAGPSSICSVHACSVHHEGSLQHQLCVRALFPCPIPCWQLIRCSRRFLGRSEIGERVVRSVPGVTLQSGAGSRQECRKHPISIRFQSFVPCPLANPCYPLKKIG
jgi:hypothetical protein